MVYKPNIPQPTNKVKNSQPDLLENFTQINTVFGNDHVAIDQANNAGKHKAATLVQQAVDPGTAADELALYSKISPTTGALEMVYRLAGNGLVREMTGGNFADPGWARLSSGVMVMWGADNANGDVTKTILSPNLAAFTVGIFAIFFTPTTVAGDPNTIVSLRSFGNPNPNSYRVFGSTRTNPAAAANCTYRYIAFGI